jgi:uncharacterized protein
MGAPVAYFEITSTDAVQLGRFYTQLFGWTLSGGPEDTYSMIDTGAGENAVGGGIGPAQGPENRGGIKIYVRVEDLQEHLDRAEKLGGTTLVAPTDLPGGYGQFAVLADPDGNAVGLWA